MQPVMQLVYTSRAKKRFSARALQSLVAGCYMRNTQRGITGVLLYGGGRFIQLLEGDKQVVESLYTNKIAKDPRHTDCMVLTRQQVEARLLPNWRMGRLYLDQTAGSAQHSWDALCGEIAGQSAKHDFTNSHAMNCIKNFIDHFNDVFTTEDTLAKPHAVADAAPQPDPRAVTREIHSVLDELPPLGTEREGASRRSA